MPCDGGIIALVHSTLDDLPVEYECGTSQQSLQPMNELNRTVTCEESLGNVAGNATTLLCKFATLSMLLMAL